MGPRSVINDVSDDLIIFRIDESCEGTMRAGLVGLSLAYWLKNWHTWFEHTTQVGSALGTVILYPDEL